MNLGFCTLASSSSGNCYLIRSEQTNLILDVGITVKKLKTDLEHLGLTLRDLDGIFITHDHGDHVKGLKSLMKKTACPVYLTEGTAVSLIKREAALPADRFFRVQAGDRVTVGDIRIGVFHSSHDTAEPVCYHFTGNGHKISVVTDTGYVSDEIFENVRDSEILAIEANHERNILLYGSYPYPLKLRILSDVGHLSNEACADCVVRMLRERNGRKPRVLLAHLSRENNTPEQALITVGNCLEEQGFTVGRDLELAVLDKDERSEFLML